MKSSLPPRTPVTSGFFKQAAFINDAARIADTICEELSLSAAVVWLETVGVDQAHGQLASSDTVRDLDSELGEWLMGLAGEYIAPDELKNVFKANQVFVSPMSTPARQLGVIVVASSADRDRLRSVSARLALELEEDDRERLVEFWSLNAPTADSEATEVVSSTPVPGLSANDNASTTRHLKAV